MRRHLILALASSASLGLFALACSSSDDDGGGGAGPDASVPPDAAAPDAEDASTRDAAPKPDAGPHDPGWDPGFSLPGVGGRVVPTVNAMARVANRQIAIAGNFEQAGSIPTKFVALWNGNKWLSIGAGLPGPIEKMVATPTGELYGTVLAGAGFETKLYKWDKTQWSEVASFDSRVTSLEMAPDGALYAAGWFTKIGASDVAHLAKLSNNAWTAVAGAPEGTALVRLVGADLCVGTVTESHEVGLHCLEGGSWTDKGFPAVQGDLYDLGVQGGDLIAAGRFRLSDEDAGGSLARWTGSAWELVGGGIEGNGDPIVTDMEIDGDKIYVTGSVTFAGGQQVSHVAMWDATKARWSSLNDGIFGQSGGWVIGAPPGQVLVRDQGGEIYVGGHFSLIGGRNALGIARWDGNQWNPVDDPTATRLGVNGSVIVVADGPADSLYVGGEFQLVGGDVAAGNVGHFTGDAWSPLGVGLDGPVMALAASGKTLYAGGFFLRSGPVLARHVAQWNGSTWSGVGAGFDAAVRALAVGPDGNLYAGGDFTEAGDVVVNHVARWNGATWQALGAGFDGEVHALAFDAAGKLYAGGTFGKSGDKDVKRIASWNGTTWSAVGDGVGGEESWDGIVRAIVTYDGKLTIGGSFDRTGTSKTLQNLASWNGTTWVDVGGGVHREWGAEIASLAARGKQLYLVGNFVEGGKAADGGAGTPLALLGVWNGTSWSDLGGGLADLGNVVHVQKDRVWIGGGFTFAGGQSSYNLARYWPSN